MFILSLDALCICSEKNQDARRMAGARITRSATRLLLLCVTSPLTFQPVISRHVISLVPPTTVTTHHNTNPTRNYVTHRKLHWYYAEMQTPSFCRTWGKHGNVYRSIRTRRFGATGHVTREAVADWLTNCARRWLAHELRATRDLCAIYNTNHIKNIRASTRLSRYLPSS